DEKQPPKWVLRRGWERELDPGSLRRRKTGFMLDIASWLQTDQWDRLRGAVEALRRNELLEARAVDAFWRRAQRLLSGEHPSRWVPAFTLLQMHLHLSRWGAS